MSADQFAKLRPTMMAQVLPRIGLTGESASLVEAEPDASAALVSLERSGLLSEALKLLAHALPKREAVWWACMCAHSTATATLPEPDRLAADAAERWVRRQADEVRREAFAHAERAGFGSAEVWVAVAAFWSGDSMSPIGQPVVPPSPHLAATAVVGSLTLASVRRHPEWREKRLRHFLGSGREIAGGGVGRLAPEEAD